MTKKWDFPSVDEVSAFFGIQLERWDDARLRFDALKGIRTKSFALGNVAINAQFNPARIVSTGAKIDRKSVAERKCFLCAANRPPQQILLPAFGESFQVLVNPFPILNSHLVIASAQHEDQILGERYAEMCVMANALTEYIVFYNGPKCGASAPDHMHFQAGLRGAIPVERHWKTLAQTLVPTPITGVSLVKNFACPALAIVADSVEQSTEIFSNLYGKLQTKSPDAEFPINVLAWREDNKLVTVIFLRSKHRPDCYFAEGEEKILVSPGSVDMGGLLITPREEDFEKLNAQIGSNILCEVTLTQQQILETLS